MKCYKCKDPMLCHEGLGLEQALDKCMLQFFASQHEEIMGTAEPKPPNVEELMAAYRTLVKMDTFIWSTLKGEEQENYVDASHSVSDTQGTIQYLIRDLKSGKYPWSIEP